MANEVAVSITGEDETLKAALSDAVGAIKGMATSVDGISAALSQNTKVTEAAAAFAGVSLSLDFVKAAADTAGRALHTVYEYIKDGIGEAIDFEISHTKIGAILEASGYAAGVFKNELLDLAEGLGRVTRFNEDAVRSAETLLLTFQNIKGDNFKRTIMLATDLAEVMGNDLPSAAFTLGKALEDPETGMLALRRAGLILSDAQKEMIKSLTEAGRAMDAQTVLLDIVEKKVGGVAEKVGATAAGQWLIFRNRLSEVAESIGRVFLPAVELLLPIVDIIATVAENIAVYFEGLVNKLKPWSNAIKTAISTGLMAVVDTFINFAADSYTFFTNFQAHAELFGTQIAADFVRMYEDTYHVLVVQLPEAFDVALRYFTNFFDGFSRVLTGASDNVTHNLGQFHEMVAALLVGNLDFKPNWKVNTTDIAKGIKDIMNAGDFKIPEFTKREQSELEMALDEQAKALQETLDKKGKVNRDELRKTLLDLTQKKEDVIKDAGGKEVEVVKAAQEEKNAALKAVDDKEQKGGDIIGLEELAKRISSAAAKAREAADAANGGGLLGLQRAFRAAQRGGNVPFGAGQPGLNVMGVPGGIIDLSRPGGPGPAANRQGPAAAGPGGDRQEKLNRAVDESNDWLKQIADNTKNIGALA